ncbi:MAG TPA: diphosphate--fructose-6-phosphate 1-phosphotransferase, partial [Lentisphaeria bacterium]|nr:diphosphate--fructose-6-phosphate 1-phosphotransferase [Lentisphaeria bacterium]
FIKLMGRSASHITLECALKTHPNITIISEEVAAKKQTLDEIVTYIANTVAARAKNKENFGVVLIPEGLIEFIPEMNKLISELNELLAKEGEAFAAIENKDEKMKFVIDRLPVELASVFASLPQTIQIQLTNDRDPHGNVQVSLIETEKLLVELVKGKLKKMPEKIKFSAQTHFFGYEGRCSVPSNFDADYCYSLGYNAAAIIGAGKTAYMSYISNLVAPAEQWKAGAVPLTAMMNVERRHGADKPVIKKALVELDGKPFQEFAKNRDTWAIKTSFIFPGPIQYYGPAEVCDATTETLKLEQAGK